MKSRQKIDEKVGFCFDFHLGLFRIVLRRLKIRFFRETFTKTWHLSEVLIYTRMIWKFRIVLKVLKSSLAFYFQVEVV